jgi:hypothetical protein
MGSIDSLPLPFASWQEGLLEIGADGKAVMVVDHENIARARRRIKALLHDRKRRDFTNESRRSSRTVNGMDPCESFDPSC